MAFTEADIRDEEILSQWYPNPDGDDYACGGKFYQHRVLLRRIRDPDNGLPDDVKRKAIKFLKEEVFPFCERNSEAHKSEGDELMGVVRKFHGAKGLRNHLIAEGEELEARIDSLGLNAELTHEAKAKFFNICLTTDLHFWIGHGGYIDYRNMHKEVAREEPGRSDFAPPVINLIPLSPNEYGNIAHHHNINPDDDLSLNHSLLKLLQDLMKLKCAEPFINFDHKRHARHYQMAIWRPRCLSFIEEGLKLDHSIGYGSTAFFNDMLLVFSNTRKENPFLYTAENKQADALQSEMMKRLETMGSAGAKLLAQYEAIRAQGPEWWSDPELAYFKPPHNPDLEGFDGTKPDRTKVSADAYWQCCFGRKRVQELRAKLASTAPTAERDIHTPAFDGGAPLAPLDQSPRKRSREQSVESKEDGPSHDAKRPRSDFSTSADHSQPRTIPLGKTASKRSRELADIDSNDEDEEVDQSEAAERTAAKRQRLTEPVAPTSLPATSSGPSRPGPSAAPPQRRSSKRLRAAAGADSDGGDHDDGDSHEASRSKRQRLTKDTNSAGLQHASPEALLSVRKSPEPAAVLSHSGQAQASSAAGQPAPQQPQQPQQPVHYPAPASQALPSSRNTVAMSKVAKMGKTRPWVFGYSTDEGYGLYAFMKCPRRNCKQRFTGHPLRNNHARDHLLSCGQPFTDEQDMVRQYASQVIKDAGRKSDLTVDWARNSNMNLLPSNAKNNHPDNFPLASADE